MNIGKKVTITASTNNTLNGLTGTIIDETKHTITIRTTTGDKKIIKTHVTFEETP